MLGLFYKQIKPENMVLYMEHLLPRAWSRNPEHHLFDLCDSLDNLITISYKMKENNQSNNFKLDRKSIAGPVGI